MKKIFTLIACCTFAVAFGQHISSLQEQKQFYSKYNFTKESDWDELRNTGASILPEAKQPSSSASSCTLTKRVFGWHPYWNGSTYTNYQWNLISDFCYFDY